MKKERKCLVLTCSSLYMLLVVLSVTFEISGGLGQGKKNLTCVLSSCKCGVVFLWCLVFFLRFPASHPFPFLLGGFQLMKLHTGSDSDCRMDTGSIHMHKEVLWDSQGFLSKSPWSRNPTEEWLRRTECTWVTSLKLLPFVNICPHRHYCLYSLCSLTGWTLHRFCG